MSGSLAAIITIPIVVAIALFSWVFAVLWANRHPRWAHHEAQQGQPLSMEVQGGAFQAVEGGRQLMPIPERRPADVPEPRTAAASETYQPGGATSTAQRTSESAQAEGSRERVGTRPPQ
jgi:hypothetical protein